MTETVCSPRSLAVTEPTPPGEMTPALQVKLSLSILLSGNTVRVLVNDNW